MIFGFITGRNLTFYLSRSISFFISVISGSLSVLSSIICSLKLLTLGAACNRNLLKFSFPPPLRDSAYSKFINHIEKIGNFLN